MSLVNTSSVATYSSHLATSAPRHSEVARGHRGGALVLSLPLVADFDIQKAHAELAKIISEASQAIEYATRENALIFIELLGSLSKKADLSINASGYIDFSWQKDRDNMCLVTVLPTGELACSVFTEGTPESFIADLNFSFPGTATFRLYDIISRLS